MYIMYTDTYICVYFQYAEYIEYIALSLSTYIYTYMIIILNAPVCTCIRMHGFSLYICLYIDIYIDIFVYMYSVYIYLFSAYGCVCDKYVHTFNIHIPIHIYI